MPDLSRRDILRAAAIGSAFSLLPASIRKALAIPANNRTGTLRDVEHVVILMQENRSFDHYFGTLPGVRGFSDRFTIPLPGDRHVWQQQGAERLVLPYHLDSKRGNAQRVTGTPHSWVDEQAAWDHGRMSAWPTYKTPASMGYYRQHELPFQFALANAFTLCDAYHCAIHAGTNTNRLFHWTGTNGPSAADVAVVVNEWDSPGPAEIGYQWTTYPERLEASGVSWKVYQFLPDNFTDNPLAGFANTAPPAFRWAIRRGRRKTSTPSCPIAMRLTRPRHCTKATATPCRPPTATIWTPCWPGSAPTYSRANCRRSAGSSRRRPIRNTPIPPARCRAAGSPKRSSTR